MATSLAPRGSMVDLIFQTQMLRQGPLHHQAALPSHAGQEFAGGSTFLKPISTAHGRRRVESLSEKLLRPFQDDEKLATQTSKVCRKQLLESQRGLLAEFPHGQFLDSPRRRIVESPRTQVLDSRGSSYRPRTQLLDSRGSSYVELPVLTPTKPASGKFVECSPDPGKRPTDQSCHRRRANAARELTDDELFSRPLRRSNAPVPITPWRPVKASPPPAPRKRAPASKSAPDLHISAHPLRNGKQHQRGGMAQARSAAIGAPQMPQAMPQSKVLAQKEFREDLLLTRSNMPVFSGDPTELMLTSQRVRFADQSPKSA